MCCMGVSLLVCWMQVNSHLFPEKDQGIQWKSTPVERGKTCGHKKYSVKYVFMYPYCRWHFHRTNWMPNTIMAQGLDSTGSNNLTCLVVQWARVICHKAQLRDLNWGTGTPFLIVDTTLSSQLVKKSSY